MSWSRRGVLRLAGGLTIAGIIPALGACGFSPVYGTGENGVNGWKALANVEVGTIPDRSGQLLRNHLIDRFYPTGYPTKTDYTLNVSVAQSTNTTILRQDQTTERLGISTVAYFSVVEKSTSRVLFSDTATAVTTATGLRQQYAYLAGIQAAGERTLIVIADEIALRTAIALGREKPGGS